MKVIVIDFVHVLASFLASTEEKIQQESAVRVFDNDGINNKYHENIPFGGITK